MSKQENKVQSTAKSQVLNMSEKFSLKWNDFNSNASKSFRVFRKEEYLHDVTLVSDDQHQTTAHKLVLSASSDYFKSIFKNNKHQNHFLCLEGISSSDLNNILDYIYNGEVQIYQEHLDRFLDIAQRFKLEGLLEGGKHEEEVEEKHKVIQSFESPLKIMHPDIAKPEPPSSSIQLNNQIQPFDRTDFTEVDQKLYENMEKNSDGTYSCKVCNKSLPKKTHMKFHVETHMEGLTFPCNICGREFRLRESLKTHRNRNHRMS